MTRSIFALLAAAAAVTCSGRTIQAQEIQYASYAQIQQIVAEQNQRLAELEAAQQTQGGCGGCCDTGCCDMGCCDTGCCNTCDGCCCDPCCRSYGIVGGAEVTFLKAHFSSGTNALDPAVNNNAEPEFDYDAAPRVWLGVQGSDGLGVRARWWQYDHSATATAGNSTYTRAIDTYVMDLEFTDSTRLGCNWDSTLFGGFRYVEFDDDSRFTGGSTHVHNDWSGYGATLGAELRRCVGNDLALFANVRGSIIMADQVISNNANLVLFDNQLDNIFHIWEAQLGAQWTRCLEDNGYLFARAAVEVQYWDSAGWTDSGPVRSEAFGLGGVALSAGVIR